MKTIQLVPIDIFGNYFSIILINFTINKHLKIITFNFHTFMNCITVMVIQILKIIIIIDVACR